MIHVIAVITAKPGKREAILQVFRANVPAVRAEKGCMEYGAAVDAENALPVQTRWGPDTFLAMVAVGRHVPRGGVGLERVHAVPLLESQRPGTSKRIIAANVCSRHWQASAIDAKRTVLS